MLIPDLETEIDYLNCEAISHTVVELLSTNRDRPITVGVHGDWGAGKSSILKMIEVKCRSDQNVAVIWFNGWMFEGFDDAKTVMIENTITELHHQRSTIEGVKEKAKSLLNRVNWLRILRRSSGVAFNLLTGLPAPDQIQTALHTLNDLADSGSDLDGNKIRVNLREVAGLLKPKEDEINIPDTVYAFQNEFRALLDAAKVDQLVVLIDDLDRCLPRTAVETLEAIRLFLCVPKTAFVIGADEAMIEYAVKQHFPELPTTSGPLPYARNYLEKLIHVPFRIPALGAQETRMYVILLLVQSVVGENHDGFKELLAKGKLSLERPWEGSALSQEDVGKIDASSKNKLNSVYVLAQQIAPILAEGTKGNPRQIKRFLNTLLLRQVIAKALGFGTSVKQSVLAKLMLAERFQPDFFKHLSLEAMRSNDGKVDDIARLESTLSSTKPNRTKKSKSKVNVSTKAKVKKLEQDTNKWRERDWLKDWLQLEPKLASEDLRPYVFVARDERLTVSTTTKDGLEKLIENLCGPRFLVRTVESDVSSLSDTDAQIVFNSLRERVLSVGRFITAPPGIEGLAIVAKHHPRLQIEVVLLLESLDATHLGVWIVKGWSESIIEEHAREKLLEVMQIWGSQEENKPLKLAALGAIPALENQG